MIRDYSSRSLVAAAVGALLMVIVATASTTHAIICPGSVTFEPSGTSLLEAGWTGLAHDQPVLGWTLDMKIDSCPDATMSTCGECTIAGLIPNAISSNQRCANDTSIVCEDDAPCQAQPGVCEDGSSNGATCTIDANCPGGTCRRRCAFFTAAPTGLSVGGVSACLTNQIRAAVTGTVDVELGALTAAVPLRSNLHLGITTDNPCPRCIGDPTAADGLQGGTCSGGPRDTFACDAAASVPERPDFGATSFDCPPSTGTFLGSLALNSYPITVATGTSTRTLSSANPSCTQSGFTGNKCFCDTCNHSAATPCSSNADCVAVGATICGGRRCLGGPNVGAACTSNTQCPGIVGGCGRPGEATRPNGCFDDTNTPGDPCQDTGPVDGMGECVDGPPTSSCTNHPQRGCATDTDCDNVLGACQSTNRHCYLDNGVLGGSVSVTGVATPPSGGVADPTTIGGLFCVPPLTSSASNAATGLPGLGRTRIPGSMTFGGAVGELTIAANAAPGSEVNSDDGEGDGATAGDPVETAITTSTGAAAGEVTLFETTQQTPPPMGFDILGAVMQITAPTGTTANPLTFVFRIDSSLTSGQTLASVELRRNGVIVDPCTDVPPQPIDPNPCVFDRSMVGDDFQISAYSSAASDWDVVAPAVAATPTATTTAAPGDTPTPTQTPTPTPTQTLTPTPTPTPTLTAVPACAAMPEICRTPVVGGKAFLALTDKDDEKDQLQWKWSAGSATDKADFGDPLTTDDYALCLYDGTGLVATLTAPAGGICATKDCWADKPKGYQYKDKEASPSGITQLQLSEGTDGKAKIQVKGKGVNLPDLDLGMLTSPLTVQLKPIGGGICFGATYSSPFTKNDAVQFKDKAD